MQMASTMLKTATIQYGRRNFISRSIVIRMLTHFGHTSD